MLVSSVCSATRISHVALVTIDKRVFGMNLERRREKGNRLRLSQMVSPEVFLDVTAVQERHSSGSPALLERVLKEVRRERAVMLASVVHSRTHMVHYFLYIIITFP